MPQSLRVAMVVLFATALCLPVFVYWLVIGRGPSVSPEKARRLLSQDRAGTVLVDIRPPSAYADERVAAARNWPFAQIRRVKSLREIPTQYAGKRLLLLCQNGILSASAARHLRSVGAGRVYAVRDGMCGWIAADAGGSGAGDSVCRLLRAPGSTARWSARPSSPLEQHATVISGFVIKPLYMVLALVLIVWLWRPAARSPDLTALRWSMVAFLGGETSCALNYLAFGHQSHLGEYLHSSGMVASFALAAAAAVSAADLRLIHFSDRKHPCAFVELCGPCAKHTDVPCGMRRLLMLLAVGAMAIALLPLCHQPETACYNTTIFGHPYNYAHPLIYQLFETRFCPIYALVFLGGALLAMAAQRRVGASAAGVLLAAGIGALGFGMFRLFLFAAFPDRLVWSVFWEEASELLTVLSAAAVLWIFRARLFVPAHRCTGHKAS
ncbi:MAG: rhodanese-like domain-containing protein [Armatimonadota bacterium]